MGGTPPLASRHPGQRGLHQPLMKAALFFILTFAFRPSPFIIETP
jgi:hypothetical protein